MILSTAEDTRQALIVHAHPEPRSFSAAQARAAAEQLSTDGLGVTLLDLYAEGWDPVLSRDQFPGQSGYFKPQTAQLDAVAGGTLTEPVRSHLTLAQDADLLILSFPLWWFSMPAILKGWIDNTFVMGAAFGGERGIFADGGMRGKKAMLLVTTGGKQADFAGGTVNGYGELDTFLFHIHRGMLEFCGYEVLRPVVTFAPVRLDDHSRTEALVRVRAAVKAAAAA